MKILLRKKPYTVSLNSVRFDGLKIVLNPLCGFVAGEKVYQVRREDGVVELVPERIFDDEYLKA